MAQPDQIDFIIADLDLFTRAEVIALTINVAANLRDNPPLGTPIDTGWASANWVPSLGEPYEGDASNRDPTPSDIAKRASEAQAGTNEVLGWKGEGILFVTNNVPYIQPLNDGHSKQSPPGFVQAAIEKGIRETESAGANKAARLRSATAARTEAGKPGSTVGSQAFQRARDRRNGK